MVCKSGKKRMPQKWYGSFLTNSWLGSKISMPMARHPKACHNYKEQKERTRTPYNAAGRGWPNLVFNFLIH